MASNLKDEVLRRARAWSKAAGLSLCALGARAVGNGHLFNRLAAGGDIRSSTAESLLDWIEANPPERFRKQKERTHAA